MMVTSCKGSRACTATLWAPDPAAGHHRPMPPPETPGHPQASPDSLLWGHCSFLLVLVHKGLLCPPRVYFLDRCKFWQLYGGVSGDLLQEGLCHTEVCCAQSPCPCGRPLLTGTSTGDAQTQFCLSLCGVPGSWCTQGLFEPSKSLWIEWGLILNVNSLLLPSCWGFSFALECGVSPHSDSIICHLTAVSLTLDLGHLHSASLVKHSGRS